MKIIKYLIVYCGITFSAEKKHFLKKMFGPPKIIFLNRNAPTNLLQEILEFYRENDKESDANPPLCIEELKEKLGKRAYYSYLAYLPDCYDESKQALVGIIRIYAWSDIKKLYVDSLLTNQHKAELCKRGVGTLLIEYTKYIGRVRGYKKISLLSSDKNTAFYKDKVGFIEKKERFPGYFRYSFLLKV